MQRLKNANIWAMGGKPPVKEPPSEKSPPIKEPPPDDKPSKDDDPSDEGEDKDTNGVNGCGRVFAAVA